jgi:hypothetical protein
MKLSDFTKQEKVTEQEKVEDFHSKVWHIPWGILDDLFLSSESIYRPLRGYAFETWFKKLLEANKVKVVMGSGDDIVDMKIDNVTLQLKTPYWRGTKDGKIIAYRFHKTHGPERFPDVLYSPEEFADFLVGWMPDFKILICPKSALPLSRTYKGKISDPVKFPWKNEWIGRFDLIGVKLKVLPGALKYSNKLLPKSGVALKLSDAEIIETIMNPANFRLFEQNLKGQLREHVCVEELKRRGIVLHPPKVSTFSTAPGVKLDGTLEDGRKIQIKGITRSISNGRILGVEIKGSHGRIPNRLYMPSAFDVLIIAIDPGSIKAHIDGIDNRAFNYYLIQSRDLPLHEKSKIWGQPRLKDIFHFDCTKVKLNNFEVLN